MVLNTPLRWNPRNTKEKFVPGGHTKEGNRITSWLNKAVVNLNFILTLPTLCISESCIKRKINVNFYFHTSLWYLKRFCKGFQSFHKTFWGTRKKREQAWTYKFKLIFSLRQGLGRVGLINKLLIRQLRRLTLLGGNNAILPLSTCKENVILVCSLFGIAGSSYSPENMLVSVEWLS